jgi:redox-sensitive bicupin YhaK (pirin superfamily)
MIPPGDFAATNPFFLMADDRTEVGGDFGEAHPHAGLETVTFMLSGSFEDLEGRLDPGDVEWMTSGRGIVHGQDTVTSNSMRLFQLWIVLPEDQRRSAPRVQRLRGRSMPVRKEAGAEAKVYSGRSGDAAARTLNAAPVTLIDLKLQPNAFFEQDLPSSYNGFIIVIEGAVIAGDPGKAVAKDQVGWLDRPAPAGAGVDALRLRAGETPARVLIFAGEPQEMSLAARGPFIAGSNAELADLFAAYRRGEFPYASSLRQEVG